MRIMMYVVLKYNPYLMETTLTVSGEPLAQDSQLMPYQYERLQVWVDKLIGILVEELNDDTFTLVFQGTEFDFEDVEEVCAYSNHHHDTDIQLEHIPAEGSSDKIGELKELFTYMQEGPFEELRSDKIRKNFEKALSSDFEIAVIATMSSGKSTLINSFLGRELMPSKQAACTATISRIKNDINNTSFIARAVDQNGGELEPWQEINLEKMTELNDNEEVSDIEIVGNIPNISTKKMNLVLVDTPGPNNSRNSSHRDHTYRVIKSDTKPMVLYILNATQFAINDDNDLINSVAQQMKSGGKQSKDRFIFAVNKVDELDPEKDGSIEDTIADVKSYLEDKGIMNPNIFPVSAEMGKLIRMEKNGYSLTRKQSSTLRDHDFFIKEELQLSNYAPLSKSKREYIKQQIIDAQMEDDTYQEALLQSGVPSIEEAINEYLEKYAVTSKITTAVNSFKDLVESKQMEQSLANDMQENKERRIGINKQMKKIKAEVANGQKASDLKERINNKKYDQREIIRRVETKIEKKINDLLDIFIDRERIEENEAKQLIDRLEGEAISLQSDIKTDLELIILATLKSDANNLLIEYKSYVKDLIEVSGGALKVDEFQIFTSEMPNVDSIVEDLAYDDDVVTGQSWVKTSTWWNPFSYGDGYYKDTYSTKTFVDVNDIASNVINPIKTSLTENIKEAETYIANQEMKLKTYFNREIDHLEKLLLEKANELEQLSDDSEMLQQKLNEDKERFEWLQDFVIRLDSILEI